MTVLDPISLLRDAGCGCDMPLLGERPGKGPRCRLCGTEATVDQLLRVYMSHVIACTGISFVRQARGFAGSSEQFDELQKLEAEIRRYHALRKKVAMSDQEVRLVAALEIVEEWLEKMIAGDGLDDTLDILAIVRLALEGANRDGRLSDSTSEA
jgi:hypothetical protein